MQYEIVTTWDEEARVWVALNDEIPLALEGGPKRLWRVGLGV
ncbi:MAG: DUF1902 domain-containing protein [Treponema sp.]|nr:DUF1902 domain-containing protein [Treponema sp.]